MNLNLLFQLLWFLYQLYFICLNAFLHFLNSLCQTLLNAFIVNNPSLLIIHISYHHLSQCLWIITHSNEWMIFKLIFNLLFFFLKSFFFLLLNLREESLWVD
jgi:hypothetical protein